MPKTNSRWNLKKRMIVTMMIILRIMAPMMTITERMDPKFPVLNCPIRVEMQTRKTIALMRVRRIV